MPVPSGIGLLGQMSLAFALMDLLDPLWDHHHDGWAADLARYWTNLADTAAFNPKDFRYSLGGAIWIVGFASLASVRPVLAYPISRARLTRAIIGLTLLQWAVVWLTWILVAWLASLSGQIISGHFLPGLGLSFLAAQNITIAVLMLPLACLSAAAPSLTFEFVGSGRGSGRGGLLGFFLVIGVFGLLDAWREHWLPWALTAHGAVAIALFGAACIPLLWWCLRRHYRACDLVGKA